MKKTIFLVVALAIQTVLFAQIDVLSVEQVQGTRDAGFHHPTFSVNGDYLLLTGANFKGLVKYDLSSKQMQTLTDADNAGYMPQISDGGKVVVFSNVEYKNNLRYTSIKSINLENQKISTIDAASREQRAFAFVGGKIKIAKRDMIISKRLANDIRTVENSYIVTIEDQDLVLYNDNKRIVLNPNGKGSYIWPSVSPDEKHIVYMSLGDGCVTYVCNIDGSNPVSLGYLASPVWLNNEWIIGMEDKDDGHVTTSSVLKAARADGSYVQTLPTPNQPIAMYPVAANNTVAYEADNAIYVMRVNVR